MNKPLRDRRQGGSRKGVATVEMALVAPVIFLLVFGSVEFSRMMMIRQALTNAARHGCRNACLVTTQSNTRPSTAIRDTLHGVIQNSAESDSIRISIEPAITSSLVTGSRITTMVEVDCSDVSWLPPFFTAGATIRGTATMKRE